ncbi:MAG: molybdopterin converting factor [Gammaproteobacteria bacterium]|nr:molybdopterin converting factor [Gammaproteobacteria bacterium]
MSSPRFRFSSSALDPNSLRLELADTSCGGYVTFEGWVRNHNEGREVRHLEYEAFAELAEREGERIIAEACKEFGVDNARCVHRVGDLTLGDLAVWVGVSARHRDEAFKACRYIIDEVKHRVPIWKKENYVDGDSGWVNCERCATTPACEHGQANEYNYSHADAHIHTHPHREPVLPSLVPDYSRQMNLREVGAAGQARLRVSRVAVVGVGGLGVPVLQYLSGAGIGRLTLIDGDRLDPSNLHRQTWYALADCGAAKAELAAARVRALNPDVDVRAHVRRLDVANSVPLLAHHDLIIDCTDNFTTKFLINDVAHSLGIPAVFASIHQYEGQLQVVDPRRRSACLRCLWPDATRDGLIGNCSEAGVLGPVPGVLGSLQALEVLKILLDLPGRLGDELLIVDLIGLNTTRVRARRNAACGVRCEPSTRGLQYSPDERRHAATATPLELEFDDLRLAIDQGYILIDIREPKEIENSPLTVVTLTVPMGEVLARRNLPSAGRYLLICTRGTRSLSATRSLRDRGLTNVFSLKGGALSLHERQGRT